MPKGGTSSFGSHEQCAHCLQLYAYEAQVHCVRCDGPACPFCVVRIDTELICIGCTEDDANADTRDVES